MKIYHLAYQDSWEVARESGVYRGRDGDRTDGFLHFSNAEQIVESAAKHKAGVEGLILIEVEADDLGNALKWESSRGGALFPHLYGDLLVSDVLAATPLPVGSDGRHVFPWLS